jgi:RHS repeat-associated protein
LMNGNTLVKAFLPLPGGGTAVYPASGSPSYRHPDWLGSSRLTSTPTRGYSSSIAYAPFGEQYDATGTAPDPSFTGQNSDTTSTLYDFLARRMSPSQGRWISPDPAGLSSVNLAMPQSLNRYAYVTNTPLISTDPTGMGCTMRDIWFCNGFGGGAGGYGLNDGSTINGISEFDLINIPVYEEQNVWVPGHEQPYGPWVPGSWTTVLVDVGPSSLLVSWDLSIGGQSGDPIHYPYPVCGIQVRCRGIEYKHLGLLGAQHCDARATDISGVVHSLSAGPDGDPLNSTLNAWDTPNPTTPFTGSTFYSNPNSCSLAGCLIDSTNQYHNSPGRPHYNGLLGPNSNTWLSGTFTSCGVNLPINTLGGIL